MTDQYAKALIDYNKAAELEPNQPDYFYYERGRVKNELKDFESAILDFTKAIQLNPDNLDAVYDKALAYKALNKQQESIQQFEIIINSINASTYLVAEAHYRVAAAKNSLNQDKTIICDHLDKAIAGGYKAAEELKSKLCY